MVPLSEVFFQQKIWWLKYLPWNLKDLRWLVGCRIHDPPLDLLGRWAQGLSASCQRRSGPRQCRQRQLCEVEESRVPRWSDHYGRENMRKLKWSLNFTWSFLSDWIRAGISNTSCLFQTTTWPAFEHPDGRLVVMGDLFQKIEDDSP